MDFIKGTWYKCSCNKNFYQFETIINKDNYDRFVSSAVINTSSDPNYGGHDHIGYKKYYNDRNLLEYFKSINKADINIVKNYLPINEQKIYELW